MWLNVSHVFKLHRSIICVITRLLSSVSPIIYTSLPPKQIPTSPVVKQYAMLNYWSLNIYNRYCCYYKSKLQTYIELFLPLGPQVWMCHPLI